MVQTKRPRSRRDMPAVHLDAAAIDVGATMHVVAVPPDRDPEPVRTFGTFTADLHRLADWLCACRIKSVVMASGLPAELRRSLACTNIIENMMGTVRRVTRNVKRWSSPSMALRWTAAAMHEAKKGFRRLKAFKQLPALRAALAAHYEKETNHHAVAQKAKAA